MQELLCNGMDLAQISVLIGPQRLDRVAAREYARRAEQAGMRKLWTVEGSFDSIGMAHELMAGTERLAVGTAVAQRWKRHPMQLAEAAATVDHLYPGRLAVGIGTAGWVEDPRQAWQQPLDHPVARMREYLELLRAALSGDTVDYRGRFYDAHDQIDFAPGARVPLYLAAGGPQLCRLAARVADGVFIEAPVASVVDGLVADTRSGLQEARRDRGGFAVHQLVHVSVAERREHARDTLRRNLISTLANTEYQRALTEEGYGEVVEAIKLHLAGGDVPRAEAALSDEVVDILGLALEPTDSVDDAWARIMGLMRPGVTDLVLYPYSTEGHWTDEYERVFRRLESLGTSSTPG
jgi:5,10-methylenetetrahydromethanopterin reductase